VTWKEYTKIGAISAYYPQKIPEEVVRRKQGRNQRRKQGRNQRRKQGRKDQRRIKR